MFAVIDAMSSLVAEEVPKLIYASPSAAQLRQIGERTFDLAFASADTAAILAAARELGLTDLDTVDLPDVSAEVGRNVLAVLRAVGAFPLPMHKLDTLLSLICSEHLTMSLDNSELRQAIREQGFVFRDELAALDESF